MELYDMANLGKKGFITKQQLLEAIQLDMETTMTQHHQSVFTSHRRKDSYFSTGQQLLKLIEDMLQGSSDPRGRMDNLA
jgi:TPP-dependent pyruvate/acetoin dehydrogenase alpha subunit